MDGDEGEELEEQAPRRGSGTRPSYASRGRRSGSQGEPESQGLSTATILAICIGVIGALLVLLMWDRITGSDSDDDTSPPPSVAPNR
jgi:hypothetical protein